MATSPPYIRKPVATIVNDMELRELKSVNFNLRAELDKLRKENCVVKQKYTQQSQQFQEEKTNLENKIKKRESFLQEQNKELDSLRKKIVIQGRENGHYKIKVEDLQNSLDHAKKDNKSLKRKLSSSPSSDAALNKLRNELEENISKKRIKLKEKCLKIEKLEQNISNEREKCAKQHDKILKLQEKLDSAQRDLKTCKNEIAEKEKEISKSQSIISIQWKTIDNNQKELQEKKALLEKSKKVVEEKENVNRVQYDIMDIIREEKKEAEEKVQMLKEELDNAEDKYLCQKTFIEKQSAYIEELVSQNSILDEALEENKNLLKKLDEKEAEIVLQVKSLNEAQNNVMDKCIVINELEKVKMEMDKNIKLGEAVVRKKNEEIKKFMGEQEKMLGFLEKVRSFSEFPGNVNNDSIENQLEELGVFIQIMERIKDELLVKSEPSPSSIGNPTPPISPESLAPPTMISGNQSRNDYLPIPTTHTVPYIMPHPPANSNVPENVTPIRLVSKTIRKKRSHGENVGKRLPGRKQNGKYAGGKFYCFCEAFFYSKNLLEQHLIQTSQQKKFKCGECKKRFLRFGVFKKHMMEIHSQPEALSRFVGGCQLCGDLFETREMFKEHGCAKRSTTEPKNIDDEDSDNAVAMETTTLPEPKPIKIMKVSEDEDEDVDVEFIDLTEDEIPIVEVLKKGIEIP